MEASDILALEADAAGDDKPENLQRFDLAGLKLSYSGIAGIVGQIADISQDSEPRGNLPAVNRHLSRAMEYLAKEIALQGFDASRPEISSRVAKMFEREHPNAE